MEALVDLQVFSVESNTETMTEKEEFEESTTCRNTGICAN